MFDGDGRAIEDDLAGVAVRNPRDDFYQSRLSRPFSPTREWTSPFVSKNPLIEDGGPRVGLRDSPTLEEDRVVFAVDFHGSASLRRRLTALGGQFAELSLGGELVGQFLLRDIDDDRDHDDAADDDGLDQAIFPS